jgi:hypothetical protein
MPGVPAPELQVLTCESSFGPRRKPGAFLFDCAPLVRFLIANIPGMGENASLKAFSPMQRQLRDERPSGSYALTTTALEKYLVC